MHGSNQIKSKIYNNKWFFWLLQQTPLNPIDCTVYGAKRNALFQPNGNARHLMIILKIEL